MKVHWKSRSDSQAVFVYNEQITEDQEEFAGLLERSH